MPAKEGHTIKHVTLKGVAEHAGVSKATASMILSGRSKHVGLFNPATVRKVHRSAAVLGYHSNVFASSLGTSRTPFFALVIAGSEHGEDWGYEAFESLLVGGVLARSADAGTFPIVLTVPPDAGPRQLKPVEDIIAGGVFGTIARTPPPAIVSRLKEQLRRGHPVVVVFPEKPSEWTSNIIDVDNIAIGELAGEMFAHNQRRKWALGGYRSASPSHEARREGLMRAARRHGARLQILRLDVNPLAVGQLPELLTPRLMRARPDAIFGVNTAATVGALMAGAKLGLRPGEDISVVGVDCPRWVEEVMARCSITSLSVSWKAAGETAMQTLLRMRAAGNARFPSTLLRPTIKVGQSCRVPEQLLARAAAPQAAGA